ncbi:receptor-type adenylate cyclase [Trypanosoma rangeli]|uniref:Receptor-type adenylate cyclase n=1 Tax=Trypanosoma rangeli TaxID=5698 RepID=A0A422N1J0_TRYRA|nr:receptor-type adenylate cyclase [Trypanosoma rangeli]RNE99336.1 receptor-type adenylate cyclase [Trypanosoma rangeli]|eukprot:RNE99336.1 receptor-type adenylate cyclase [Trypanosoma rangeli]
MKRFVEGYRAEAVGEGRMAFRLSYCNVSNAFIAAGVQWGAPSDSWQQCCATCDGGCVVGFPSFLFRQRLTLGVRSVAFIGSLELQFLALVEHLGNTTPVRCRGDARVFVAFPEFAPLHADFVAAFAGGAGADRAVFLRSLPHWGDANSTSETA